jgi:hypothetical protein
MNPEFLELTQTERPPLGVKPQKLHDELRMIEILEASIRYLKAGDNPPIEWKNELSELWTKRLYGNYGKM